MAILDAERLKETPHYEVAEVACPGLFGDSEDAVLLRGLLWDETKRLQTQAKQAKNGEIPPPDIVRICVCDEHGASILGPNFNLDKWPVKYLKLFSEMALTLSGLADDEDDGEDGDEDDDKEPE